MDCDRRGGRRGEAVLGLRVAGCLRRARRPELPVTTGRWSGLAVERGRWRRVKWRRKCAMCAAAGPGVVALCDRAAGRGSGEDEWDVAPQGVVSSAKGGRWGGVREGWILICKVSESFQMPGGWAERGNRAGPYGWRPAAK